MKQLCIIDLDVLQLELPVTRKVQGGRYEANYTSGYDSDKASGYFSSYSVSGKNISVLIGAKVDGAAAAAAAAAAAVGDNAIASTTISVFTHV